MNVHPRATGERRGMSDRPLLEVFTLTLLRANIVEQSPQIAGEEPPVDADHDVFTPWSR
jgi:hypothetical protein